MISSKTSSGNIWEEKKIDEYRIESFSQKKSISIILSKLLLIRNINEDNYEEYINPNIALNMPNPFALLDMEKSVLRCIDSLKNNQKIGIIADYDVDGSTSASILYKFLKNYTSKIVLKIPNRLSEGYGPNPRLM